LFVGGRKKTAGQLALGRKKIRLQNPQMDVSIEQGGERLRQGELDQPICSEVHC